MRLRSWSDFYWSHHALEKIAYYNWHLRTVFSAFEEAIEVEKDEERLALDFRKHGGFKGYYSKMLLKGQMMFVLDKHKVVTVYQFGKQNEYVRVTVNGKDRLLPYHKAIQLQEETK